MEKRTLTLTTKLCLLMICLSCFSCNLSSPEKIVGIPKLTTQTTPPLTSTTSPTQTVVPTSTPSPTMTATESSTPAPTRTPQPSETPAPTDTTTPSPTETDASSGITVITISEKVRVGDYVSAKIQTKPGMSCKLVYTTPSGTKSTAKGVGETTAGADGTCAWRWRIGTSTKPGTGKIVITVESQSETFPIEVFK